MGDPSAHHQQQMIGLGQQANTAKTRSSIVRAGSAMRAATAGRVLPAGGHSDVQIESGKSVRCRSTPSAVSNSIRSSTSSICRENAWPALP